MEEIITSRTNPVVKLVRSLRQKKERDKTDVFIVEGIHHTGEVIDAGWKITLIIQAPDLLRSDYARQVVKAQKEKGIRIASLDENIFNGLAEKENPQGIMAIVKKRKYPIDAMEIKPGQVAAAIITPQDPGNIGTILRTLDAVGGVGLFLLDGGADPYHPSSVRASMGTLFWLPIIQTTSSEFFRWARSQKHSIIGTSSHAKNDNQDIFSSTRSLILLLGSEQKGLQTDQLSLCDATIALPMRGRATSLNLAVAAGVLLYKLADITKKQAV